MYNVKIVVLIIALISCSASFSQNKKLVKKDKIKETTTETPVKQEVGTKVDEITQSVSESSLDVKLTAYDLGEAIQNASMVTKLVLKKKNLTNIPSEISQLSNLVELDLSDNEITECSSVLNALNKLKTLNLSGNKLKSIPSEICGLKNLQSLNLSNNQISDGSIGCVSNIERLYLNNNKFSTFPEGLFQLNSLKSLLIQGNQLTSIPEKINDLKQLQLFVVHLNKIQEEPLFINLEKLNTFYFYPQSLPSSINYFYVKNESDLNVVNSTLNARLQSKFVNINNNNNYQKDEKSTEVNSNQVGDIIEDAEYNIHSYPIANGYRLIKIGKHDYKKYSFFRLYINAIGYLYGTSEIHWLISKRHRSNIRLTRIDNNQKAIEKLSLKKPNRTRLKRMNKINKSTIKIYRKYLRSQGLKAS